MHKINSLSALQSAIVVLENQQEEERKLLKEQFIHAYESMKPINIIKNTFKDAAASKELKDNITNTVVALSAGFVYNLVVDKVTNTPIKKILSTALMAGITAIVEKNSDGLKSFGGELLNLFKKKSGEKRSVQVEDEEDFL